MPQDLGPWLHIGEDGTISAFTGKAEVGQNTRTALTQGVAEELRMPVSSIQLVMSDTDRVPFDAGTFGSRSMPDMLPQMRKVGATARELLIDRAAVMLNADRSQLKAADAKDYEHATGKSLAYSELVRGQNVMATAPVGQAQLTPVSDWSVLGTSAAKVDGRAMVTGAHRYSSDQRLPGMLYGCVEGRPRRVQRSKQ